jgi:hypothetical protein
MRLLFVVAFAASAAFGCASTTLGASESRVPVLLGPVPCIGCAPGSAVRVTPASMPARAVRKDLSCPFCVPVPTGPGWAGNWDRGTAFKKHAEYLGAPSCAGALQLTELHAKAWTFAIPPFFWYAVGEIAGDVTAVRTTEATCAAP